VIVYWAYALLVVPWIEPPADLHPEEAITEEARLGANGAVDVPLRELQSLFPPGSWELKNPKILESDRATLLLQEYHNHNDGSVEIHPCTIVFRDETQPLRQSVILEAPGGALLQFDQPLDINHAKIGRLVKGQLIGPVTIRSDWKEPGPEDDLLITTRDIQLTEKTIFHPAAG